MTDFGQYEAEDFVMNEDFIRWVFEKRPADEQWWQHWLQQNPMQQAAIDNARSILLSLKIKEPFINNDKEERQIQSILDAAHKKQSNSLLYIWSRWKYAAIVIGVLVIGAFLYSTLHRSPAIYHGNMADKDLPGKTEGIIEFVNRDNEVKVVHLQDGSTVHLSSQSVIRYAGEMGKSDSRDVYLSGEAFFEVTKNPNKPFRVFCHELVTKVLGTSFTVKANEDDPQISIIVRTGKVSVYKKNQIQDHKGADHKNLTGVVLVPNQKLVYGRRQQRFEKTLVDNPVLLDSSEITRNFHYDNVPVSEVLRELRKAFGIKILYDEEAIRNCRITADLSTESIYKKLELICRAMGTKYEIVDGQITIEAKPCE